jgi:hypothetical protein
VREGEGKVSAFRYTVEPLYRWTVLEVTLFVHKQYSLGRENVSFLERRPHIQGCPYREVPLYQFYHCY